LISQRDIVLVPWPFRDNKGTKEEGSLRHSDPEKTILDFVYLARQKGSPAERIVADVSSWAKGLSKNRLRRYAKKYPKTVRAIADMMMG
jgi:hypothetical protein